MNAVKKIIIGLIAIVVILVAAVAIAVSTVDINQYRSQIAEALSKQTGRTVKLDGALKLAISKTGIALDIEKASIGNPSWASRPEMASIDKLQLGLALMPLIDHKFVVTNLTVQNADIQMETGPNNQHNWEMTPAPAPNVGAVAGKPVQAASSSGAVGISVEKVSITDSKLAMRDRAGATSAVAVDKLTLAPASRGVEVNFAGTYNGTPVKLDLKTGAKDLMTSTTWPMDADITYANYHITAQGTANTNNKSADLTSYELSAGGSSIHGKMAINASGAKTELHGTVEGDKIDVADFKPPESKPEAKPAAPAKEQPASPSGPMFSTAPMDLSALKTANASIDVHIGEVVLGKSTLKQLTSKLALANGDLSLSPVKATLGESPLEGEIKLDAAATPAKYELTFKAPGVNMADLLAAADTQQFISGKGDIDIELSGAGGSPHDMASMTNGHITVTAAGGKIDASAAGSVAAGLAQVLAPGNGNPTLNCVAARFVVTNGLGKDNGILADSSASTVAGSGGFNLGTEVIDLAIQAKPKLVNTRGLTPALHITGALNHPSFGIDTAATAANVAGTLLKDKLSGGGIGGIAGGLLGGVAGSSGEATVPALAANVPEGQNACVYTLDHKAAATAAAPAQPQSNNAVQNAAGAAKTKAKDAGTKMLQGILGH